MAYATLADMQALYGAVEVQRCSDWDNTGSLNVNNVNACLSAAADEMDSYLAVRYELPLDDLSVTDDLVRKNVEIGMYKLCPYATTWTELKEKRYKDAIAWLKLLADGKVTLGPGQNTQTPAVTADIRIENAELGYALTRDSLRRVI